MSKMFDYLVNGGNKEAELEASLEHMGGCLGVEIEENSQLRAEIERLRGGLVCLGILNASGGHFDAEIDKVIRDLAVPVSSADQKTLDR